MLDISQMAGCPVLVVGDVMLDRYITGDATRLSPEAPVPVLKAADHLIQPGGAANVAANLAGMGADVSLIGVIGDDDAGRMLTEILEATGVKTSMVIDPSRPTIEKTRMMDGDKHLLRLDREDTSPIGPDTEARILSYLDEGMPEAVLISDYSKGVLTPSILEKLTQSKICVVDSKGQDYSRYRGASMITPNMQELSALFPDMRDHEAAMAVCNNYGIASVLLTRSDKGVSLYTLNGDVFHSPAQARVVREVSGAGDTVLASATLALTAGFALEDVAVIGNLAGSLAVEKSGTSIVTLAEIEARYNAPLDLAPIMSWEQAKLQVEQWRSEGLKIGFTNGTFDILHRGHLMVLAKSAVLCDRLIVGMNSDASVKRYKSEDRPINAESDRAMMLAGMKPVDMVVQFGDEPQEADTPGMLVAYLQPDVIMKGGDYEAKDVVGADTVLARGGQVIIIPFEEGYSTTSTIAKTGLL